MNKPLIIAPSLLAVLDKHGPEESGLIAAALAVQEAGAGWLHIDIMAPPAMPRTTFEASLLLALHQGGITLPLDVHLMTPPDPYIAQFAQAGATHLCFHPKFCVSDTEIASQLTYVQSLGIKAGLALDTDEAPEILKPFIASGLCEQVTLMTVKAGAGGQSFMPEMLDKIAIIRQFNPSMPIVLDGGINRNSITQAAKAGANVVVAGSAVFGAADMKAEITHLIEL